MKLVSLRRAFLAGSALAVFAALPQAPAAAAQFTTLYSFAGAGDGAVPVASLIFDAAGALYGTASEGGNLTACPVVAGRPVPGCGVAFKLSPPAGGQQAWQETVLHTFLGGTDSRNPSGPLIFDSSGVLYGTTFGSYNEAGPDFGGVFKLTPPQAGHTVWTHTVLHSFDGKNGWQSLYCALILDSQGTLYGTASTNLEGSSAEGYKAGIAFSLSQPVAGKSNLHPTTLAKFHLDQAPGSNPLGSLLMDSTGALYGTVEDGGVYKLVPPAPGQTTWTKVSLIEFTSPFSKLGAPQSGLLMDSTGILYGTGSYGGNGPRGTAGGVYSLTPPKTGHTDWTETVIYNFQGPPMGSTQTNADGTAPIGPLVMDSSGALYGTTQTGGNTCSLPAPGDQLLPGCGIIFKLTPPASGSTAWTEAVLYRFSGGSDGGQPTAGLVMGTDGALYGAAAGGGDHGMGTVFRFSP